MFDNLINQFSVRYGKASKVKITSFGQRESRGSGEYIIYNNSQDIFIDSNTRVFQETKYGICFNIKRKNLTLTPSKNSEMYTKFRPTKGGCGSKFSIFPKK